MTRYIKIEDWQDIDSVCGKCVVRQGIITDTATNKILCKNCFDTQYMKEVGDWEAH